MVKFLRKIFSPGFRASARNPKMDDNESDLVALVLKFRCFKKLVSSKLGSSFDDDQDSNLITKKFWSYVKATSKNTRIPELIHLDEVQRNSPLEQADLFNSFFYQQFSTPSNYDVPVNFTGDHVDSSMFSSPLIFNILRK